VWGSSNDDSIQWGKKVVVGVGKANFQKSQKRYMGYEDKSHASQNDFLKRETKCGWTQSFSLASRLKS
jgi:hypothetical protein